VGRRNFIHGYTASLALFVKKSALPHPDKKNLQSV